MGLFDAQVGLCLQGSHPGSRAAGLVTDRGLQTGRRRSDHCDRHRPDAKRLEVAKALGADHVIDVTQEDPLARIMDITGGEGVDVSLDCAAGAGTAPLLLGVDALKRKGGVLLVQGELAEFPNFPLGKVTVKYITIKSARGHSYRACELALQQLASQRFPLELVTTHAFGLSEAEYAIKSVGNEGAQDVIHVSLMPWK